MDVIWAAFAGSLFLAFLYREHLPKTPPCPDSVDLNKQTTQRPVVKFLVVPIELVHKATQTSRESTPMSCESSLPFSFDEGYLNSLEFTNTDENL